MVNLMWENILKKTQSFKSTHSFLKESYLFQDLNRVEFKLLISVCHVRNYIAGETIFQQGEVGIGMYFIAQGEIDITLQDSSSQENNSTFITRLSHSDFFGELSLIEQNNRRSASATAHRDSVLYGFFKPDLQEIMNRNSSAGAKINLRLAEILARRLRETTDKISELGQELKQLQSMTNKVDDNDISPFTS